MKKYELKRIEKLNFMDVLSKFNRENYSGIVEISEENWRTTFNLNGRKDTFYFKTTRYEIKDGTYRTLRKNGNKTKWNKIKANKYKESYEEKMENEYEERINCPINYSLEDWRHKQQEINCINFDEEEEIF